MSYRVTRKELEEKVSSITMLEKETAKKIKFKLEYMLLTSSVGRIEEAEKALQDVLNILNEAIEA